MVEREPDRSRLPNASDSQLLHLACQEVRDRVALGEHHVAESVIERLGTTATDPEHTIEVIYTEYDAQLLAGNAVSLAEYQSRFPQFEERLARLFEIHAALADDNDDQDTANGQSIATQPLVSGGSNSSLTQETSFPGYSVLEEVARGGMGIVYRARDERLRRIVAIKTLRSTWADEASKQRLLREAAAAAKLQHPNVAQIFEVGETAGGPYCVMEWVAGGTLSSLTSVRTLEPGEAVDLIVKLATAVHYAHERGIVHRDLKPANILLADHQEPKIVDFGLAKIASLTPTDASADTQTGAIVGTPSYMAPEQVSGNSAQVGRTTDVYALGAVLYEMLTAKPPFRGASALDTLTMVASSEVVPPSTLTPNLPRDLESICLKCLSKSPEERYSTAAELLADVDRFQRGVPTIARPIPRIVHASRWARRNPTIASLLCALCLTVVAGLLGMNWQRNQAAEMAKRADEERQAAQLERVEADRQRKLAIAAQDRAEENFEAAKNLVESFTELGAQFTRLPETEKAGRQILEQSLDFHDRVLELDDSQATKYSAARAFHRAARIQNGLGRWNEALAASERSVKLFEELRQRAPNNEDFAFWHLESDFQRGYALRGQGDFDEGKRAFAHAVELGEALVTRFPDTVKLKSLLSVTLINYRTFFPTTSRESDKALRQAIQLQEGVVAVDPEGIWPLQDLALGKENLARLQMTQGKIDEAESQYEEVIELQERVITMDPVTPEHRFYLARNLSAVAELYDSTERFQEAHTKHSRALSLAQQLKEEREQSLSFCALHVECRNALMMHHLRANNSAEAIAQLHSLVVDFKEIINEWPLDEAQPKRAFQVVANFVDASEDANATMQSDLSAAAKEAIVELFSVYKLRLNKAVDPTRKQVRLETLEHISKTAAGVGAEDIANSAGAYAPALNTIRLSPRVLRLRIPPMNRPAPDDGASSADQTPQLIRQDPRAPSEADVKIQN